MKLPSLLRSAALVVLGAISTACQSSSKTANHPQSVSCPVPLLGDSKNSSYQSIHDGASLKACVAYKYGLEDKFDRSSAAVLSKLIAMDLASLGDFTDCSELPSRPPVTVDLCGGGIVVYGKTWNFDVRTGKLTQYLSW